MTTTFDGVLLPDASKIAETPELIFTESVLLSGKRCIQASAEMGFGATYRCTGTWAQYKAILGCVGSSGSLVTEAGGEPYTYCYITGIRVEETDQPGLYQFEVNFRQDTS